MKRKNIIFLIALSLLLIVVLTSCSRSYGQLVASMEGYASMLKRDIPKDLRLTIYYMPTDILTGKPLNKEDLIRYSSTQKIVVEAEALAEQKELLKKLDASILQPVQEETYINARLYYVFEVGESEKLLEVVISPKYLGKIQGNVVVNDIEVEDNPVFYELIEPFLTEDAHNALGI